MVWLVAWLGHRATPSASLAKFLIVVFVAFFVGAAVVLSAHVTSLGPALLALTWGLLAVQEAPIAPQEGPARAARREGLVSLFARRAVVVIAAGAPLVSRTRTARVCRGRRSGAAHVPRGPRLAHGLGDVSAPMGRRSGAF